MTAEKGRIIRPGPEWKDFRRNIDFTSCVVLTDEHTASFCLPYFREEYLDIPFFQISIAVGEDSKTLENAENIWQQMLGRAVDRDALMICLGGGVVTDLGGYAAASYKRGIKCLHVPTTSLAMADAAIGGKNGVNFQGIKNQIGTFYLPEAVLIDTHFLKTLPEAELKSGFIETVKHALIADRSLWEQICTTGHNRAMVDEDIMIRSSRIKENIVRMDMEDRGTRQVLNFGHTIGHALEACGGLLHGEAIAFGIVAESYLSAGHYGLSQFELDAITGYIQAFNIDFGGLHIDINKLEYNMMHDKKNSGGVIRFSLIPEIGRAEIGCLMEKGAIRESIAYAIDILL